MARLKIATTRTTPPDVINTFDGLKKAIANAGETRLHAFISPRLAKELLVNQPAAYQRRLDRYTVGLYQRQMASEPSKWRSYLADNQMTFDTDCSMMEGQHRCVASVAANKAFGAWIIGNQPKEDLKYLGQTRARSLSSTLEMYGVHNATNIASIAKLFKFWALNESPLARGRISPDEADEILGLFPDIYEWFLAANRIKKQNKTTPSVPWLAYILGQMQIANEVQAERFIRRLEDHSSEGMCGVLLRTWNSRMASNAVSSKVWYHNTAARAWESWIKDEYKERLMAPKDRLLSWISA